MCVSYACNKPPYNHNLVERGKFNKWIAFVLYSIRVIYIKVKM